MTLTVVRMRSRETLLAEAEVEMRSWRKATREEMSEVSKRAKLSRPPGRGGGREVGRSLGWELREERGGGMEARIPGVSAPLTVGRRGSGGQWSEGEEE